MDEFSRKARQGKGRSRERGSDRKLQGQWAVQDAKPQQLGICWFRRHLPGSADNYRWFWEKGKAQVSMDSCEEDDHAGNAKNTSANTHLVLGLVVQACSASYFRAGSRRIKSLRPPWAIEGVQEQPGGIY